MPVLFCLIAAGVFGSKWKNDVTGKYFYSEIFLYLKIFTQIGLHNENLKTVEGTLARPTSFPLMGRSHQITSDGHRMDIG